jgi:hypothetical protein
MRLINLEPFAPPGTLFPAPFRTPTTTALLESLDPIHFFTFLHRSSLARTPSESLVRAFNAYAI